MSAQCYEHRFGYCTNAKTCFNVHIGAILAERRVLLGYVQTSKQRGKKLAADWSGAAWRPGAPYGTTGTMVNPALGQGLDSQGQGLELSLKVNWHDTRGQSQGHIVSNKYCKHKTAEKVSDWRYGFHLFSVVLENMFTFHLASAVAHRRIPFQSNNCNVFVAHRSNAIVYRHWHFKRPMNSVTYVVHSSKRPSPSEPCNEVHCFQRCSGVE